MRKSSGCNFYGFLHLDCRDLSNLKKLNVKITSFRMARFKFSLFITALHGNKNCKLSNRQLW